MMRMGNYKWAEKFLHASAEQGNADGQYMLGFCYAEKECALNKGLPSDEAKALAQTEGLKWVRKAANRGHADAQHLMGLNYAYGLEKAGLAADVKKAEEWFRKAAAQGHPDAKKMMD